jgi:hypothetical protein
MSLEDNIIFNRDEEFDLDMEFVPNMEIFEEDSGDDDMINEEIINNNSNKKETVNKTKKPKENEELMDCEICENPYGYKVKIKYSYFNRGTVYCKECKSNLFHLFEIEFLNRISELGLEIPGKKRLLDLIKHLINNLIDTEFTSNLISNIFNEISKKYKNEIENYIPYENIKVLDNENNFCCFTTIKRMNKFINEGSVDVLGEKIIRWKFPKSTSRNFDFQIKEDKIKKNKCFCCGNTKFLKSLSIFPDKKSLSIFLRDNVLIHFFFACCSKCRISFDKNKTICNNYFYEIMNKNCDEYIEELYQRNENKKIMEFVDEYIGKFKELV